MLKQKPVIGDTIVCNNGQVYTCCALSDLTDEQRGVAESRRESGTLGDIIGKLSTGWMHWDSSIDGGEESFNWKIKEIFREFRPKIGDTIVTAERGNFICSEVLSDGGFYGKRDDCSWQNWDKNGVPPWIVYPKIQDAYRVVEIIPAVQAQESTLEFRIRVLQKEVQMLTRLLLKEGKL